MASTAMVTAKRIRQRLLLAPRARAVPVWGTAILAIGLALAQLPLPWLALGLGGLLLALATAVRPHRALYLVAFAVPFGSLFQVSIGPVTVGVTEALLGWMLVTWVASRVALGERRVRLPSLSVAVLVFVGVTLYSLLNATSLPLAAKELAKWLEVAAVIAFVYNTVPPEKVSSLIAALLAAGLGEALLGVYQFLTQSGPEGFILHGRFMRAYGTFEQPNPYAGYLGLVAPLALATALGLLAPSAAADRDHPNALQHGPRWLEWFSLGVFALVSIAIGMSWSRGAWIGFAVATAVVGTAQGRRTRAILGVVLVLVLLAGLVGATGALPAPVTDRLTSFLPFVDASDPAAVEVTDANYASLERLAHWQSALDMWRDHPWLGVGFGNYAASYAQYALPKWPMALGHAHNYYLNIAAETGLLGLVAYLCLWSIVCWYLWRVARVPSEQRTRALAIGTLGMLVHVSVHNIVDNLWVHNIYIYVAIALGLVQVVGSRCASAETM